jgi:hypothetical protein
LGIADCEFAAQRIRRQRIRIHREARLAIEFTVPGAPTSLARDIEAFAQADGHVTAIVVPWESSATELRLSVTAVRADGWAIEHTDLGTIVLTAAGGATRLTASASAGTRPDADKLAVLFERFADALRRRYAAADAATDAPSR